MGYEGINMGKIVFIPEQENAPQIDTGLPQDNMQDSMNFQSDEESSGASLLRNATALGASAVSGIAGAPGNLLNFGLGAANYLSGGKVPSYQDVQENLPVSLPTSTQVKEKIGSLLPQDYLKPQSKEAEYINSFVEDLSSMVVPGKIPFLSSLGKIPFIKSLKTAAASNLVPYSVSKAGFGKDAENVAKIITLTGPSLIDAGSLSKASGKLKNDAMKLAESTPISAAGLPAVTGKLYKWLSSSKEMTPAQDSLTKSLSDVGSSFSKGKIPANKLIDLAEKVSEASKDTKAIEGFEPLFKSVEKGITDILKAGKGTYWAPYERALSIESALNERSVLLDSLNKIKSKFDTISPTTKTILGIGAASGGLKNASSLVKNFGPEASLIAGGVGGTILAEKAFRALQYPGVQKHVGQVLKAGAKRRGLPTVKALSKAVDDLNESVMKYEDI
jgi:hypothetical protein